MRNLKNVKKSWYYWMYKYAIKKGYGSTVPDFDQGLLTEKEFRESMRGQTIHNISKQELLELRDLAKGIRPKAWKKLK
mgnify:CR=1 FL=1